MTPEKRFWGLWMGVILLLLFSALGLQVVANNASETLAPPSKVGKIRPPLVVISFQ